MSEKMSNPEQSLFKKKHSDWLNKAKVEVGAGALGLTGSIMGPILLTALGITNLPLLCVGAALAAFGGYKFFKKDIASQYK